MNIVNETESKEEVMSANDVEQVEIIAYKGFDKNMQCRGYQYEVGKTYMHGGAVEACSSGFHSCENPLDVWAYYDICSDNRFAVVKVSGEMSRHAEDSKIASASITIGVELQLPDFINAAVDWIKKACESVGDKIASGYRSQLAASGNYSKLAASGNYSQLAASGNYSQLAASGDDSQLAASGYRSKLAASGYRSQLAASGYRSKLAASGNYSKLAASGYRSKLAASGNYSELAASGASSIAMAAAPSCAAKVGENGTIVLTRWVEAEKRYRVSVAYVGENGIKADTWYSLDDNGTFVEVVK